MDRGVDDTPEHATIWWWCSDIVQCVIWYLSIWYLMFHHNSDVIITHTYTFVCIVWNMLGIHTHLNTPLKLSWACLPYSLPFHLLSTVNIHQWFNWICYPMLLHCHRRIIVYTQMIYFIIALSVLQYFTYLIHCHKKNNIKLPANFVMIPVVQHSTYLIHCH